MDIHSNLEYLCRVCAANTKGRNSVAECVYILKTTGLKDKLDKFLYLKISENDSLPKVLCKSCFRQVEATASLSKIAKHTQQVFRDFLLSNLPKGPSQSTSTSEFTSSDFMGSKILNDKNNETVASVPVPISSMMQQPPVTSAPILPPPPLVQHSTTHKNDDVVVNVSVADPLTRDNQQKMISNLQRRQSSLLEARFTPKSIAQKQNITALAPPRPIAPKFNQQTEPINIINNQKLTAPLINFYPVKSQQQIKPQQPPQATQITTFSSGGYVIGRVNSNSNDKEETKKTTSPLTSSADNILQQKRKNLVKALNNIKANNSGQVSLLKSSQQKQAEALQNNGKTPLSEVVNQSTDDVLPDKIIIAAPKNKSTSDKSRKEPLNLSSKTPATIAQLPPTASTAAVNQQPTEESNNLATNIPKPAFPEDITLGRVIRDMDLLKLILKALKWPVSKQNIEVQLQHLRSSKFTDIMSDSNLLQDTDLTQLLGPYLAPVLLAAQALQQQQQQILNNASILSNQNIAASLPPPTKMTALEVAQAEINKSIPYKLPPETSVQLVPATPEETEDNQSPPPPTVNTLTCASVSVKRPRETKSATVTAKKQRKTAAQKARDSIVISDEEESTTGQVAPKKTRQRSNRSNANLQFELNPNFITQFNMLAGAGGTEADELMALLLKQKAALLKDNKVQNRRRNSVANLVTLPPSEFDALIDLDDDIVLMEPVSTTSTETGNFVPEQQQQQTQQQQLQQKTDNTNTFLIPPVPLITRPIIKRRKTVINSPKNKFELSTEMKNKEQLATSSISLLKTKEKLMEETINQVAMGNITNTDSTTIPLQTVTAEKVTVVAPVDLQQPVKQKKLQNKSTLGKQLLEAIGLQKQPIKIVNNTPNETPSSSTVTKTATAQPNGKQSVQQIRTALKKSLKQVQEQQQQKKKELSSTDTIIQDADSTTKPVIKEILVLQNKANKDADNCSSEVDVEEQIDKVTLMVRNNDKDSSVQFGKNQEEKEMKNASTKKNTERHSAMTNRNTADQEKYNKEHDPYGEIIEKTEANIDNEKLPKDNPAKITSSLITDVVTTPKRRGRKRLVDKLLEQEAAESKERENDNKATSSLAEDPETADKTAEEESDPTFRIDEENESNKNSGRPTRQSKTQSKYYKGPDKPVLGRRSLPSRTTRNR